MSTEQQKPVTGPSTQDTQDIRDTETGTTTTTVPPVDTTGTSGAEWGAQQPKRKRSVKKMAAALAVALGIAGAGTAVVYAATGSDSSTDQSQGAGGMGGGPRGQSGGGPGGAGQLLDALHGEYVVSDGSGNYTTELLQNGEVTAISDTSITAKSDDGYTKTYTIDSDTVVGNGSADLSSIETGDDVTIVATVSGDTATVDSLTEAGTGQMGQTPPGQQQGTTNGTTRDSESDTGTTTSSS
jgi:hypothetical protein